MTTAPSRVRKAGQVIYERIILKKPGRGKILGVLGLLVCLEPCLFAAFAGIIDERAAWSWHGMFLTIAPCLMFARVASVFLS